MAAVRKSAISHFAFPSFLAKMVANPNYLPILIGFPVILLLAVLYFTGHLHIPPGEIVFSHFMPHKYIDAIFIPLSLFAGIAFCIGLTRFWKSMNINFPNGANPKKGLIQSFVLCVLEILTHSKFNKCETNKPRSLAHLGIFYGFIGLGITTALAVFYLYVLGQESPYPLTSPLKIIGNISGILLFLGCTLAIINRIKNKDKTSIGTYFDWSLLIVIYVVVISGLLSQFTRLAGIAYLAYPIYFIHLTSVFFLFMTAPYSKLAHILYRTLAMTYAKQFQR
jgi:quinone-modifying oxidoreductase subunit QmoC